MLAHERGTPFRILALDGGGVRCALQAALLARLCQADEGFAERLAGDNSGPSGAPKIDLIVGTSAGSIMGMGLALGWVPERLVEFCKEFAPAAFPNSLASTLESVDGLATAAFSNEPLKALLETKVAEGTRLKDLKRTIAVPTFNACVAEDVRGYEAERCMQSCWRPELLHNMPGSDSGGVLSIDAVLRSAAAPTYFPLYQGYVDGGMFANNPAMAGVTLAVQYGVPIEDITVFSISTGCNPEALPVDDANQSRGLVQWAPDLISLLMSASSESTDAACRMMLGGRYCRVNPMLPDTISLDDAEAVPKLIELAGTVDLEPALQWLASQWGDAQTADLATETENSLSPDSPAGWRCSIQ